MRQPTYPAVLTVCAGLAIGAATGRATAAAGEFDHADFDRILKSNIRDERVDYLAIRKNHWVGLLAYLDRMASFDPARLSRDARLAFYINLYNATMIRAVIARFRADYSPSENDFAVFKEPLAHVGGRVMSLNHLENKVIRPGFGDPRIHAALVCAARSCPPLLPRAYRANDLDAVLEANMRSFIRDSDRNKVDRRRRHLALSPIFDWYAADFGGPNAVTAYVDRYHADDVADFTVSFVEYSWDLNAASPGSGEWISVAAGSASLWATPARRRQVGSAGKGEVFEVLGRRGDALRIHRPTLGLESWIAADKTVRY